jgi:hypothetical protein
MPSLASAIRPRALRQTIASIVIALGWSGCTCANQVSINPPRVPQGGRAIAIAVSFDDVKRIVVASASGGLFRTFDGGLSFQHLDQFPTFAPLDVAIASLNHDVVLATARDDFRTTSGGGIWRSGDGGATWTRPAGWPPSPSSTCPFRPTARGISHMPLTRTFYVATDCGIAVSNDNGATFSTMVLDPSSPAIQGVLVLNRSTGVASDANRLWFLSNGVWQPATGGPTTGGDKSIHIFAAPFWTNSGIFYHVGRDRLLYFSRDNGATWNEMPTKPHGGGREEIVRVARGLDQDPTHIDIYFADGFSLWREAVTTGVPEGHVEDWRELHSDHRDPGDVAFSPGFVLPIMEASDGGVHLTPDSGKTWKLTGSAFGGFTALQIGEVTGRTVAGSPPHTDLYFATQDNDLKGSSDGGHTWNGHICCEGAFFSADAFNFSASDSKVTALDCPSCFPVLVDPHFGDTPSPAAFPNAAAGADVPFEILGPTFLQEVPNPGPPFVGNYFLTKDTGGSWAQIFSLPVARIGRIQFAGNLANPVAYIPVKRPSKIGLVRVQDVATQPIVTNADSTLITLGRLNTDEAAYVAVAADPSTPNHLLAADIGAGTMKASVNGGATWFALPTLTTAVLDSGRFLMSQGNASFATTIAWDPANNCHILIGTMQNGVIRSADGGRTWLRVPGSNVVTFVTSFFFPPTGSIWMSAYGRGLWNLSVDRSKQAGTRCAFPQPGGADTLIIAGTQIGGPQVQVFNTAKSRIPSMVQTGDTAAVYGYGFVPGLGVSLVVEGDTVARGITVARNGAFTARVRAVGGPGQMTVTAVQSDGKRVTKGEGSIVVVANESQTGGRH